MIAEKAAAGAGWPDELVRLYRDEYVGFVQLAYLLVGSTALADEIVQDAFLAGRARWEGIRTSPGGYLRQSVVNGARSRLRRDRVEARHQPDPPPADARADLVELREALAALPLPQRTAIVMRFWAGATDEETARALDCRVGTVRSHISRGIARLRKELA